MQAKTTLDKELDQTVVVQWLLLKKSVSISEHPIGPTESNVVSYHAWDSNINRTRGAENLWNHRIESETLESWNIENEELIAVVSLVSLESKRIEGSGSSEIFIPASQESERNHATSFLLISSGTFKSKHLLPASIWKIGICRRLAGITDRQLLVSPRTSKASGCVYRRYCS